MSGNEAIRARIVSLARSFVGSTAWDNAADNGNFGPQTNKCNLFVYHVLTLAGASPGLPHGHWYWKLYPPTAGDWPDPSYDIPNWRVLSSSEEPEPGDIISQRIKYDDANGHVMIVVDGKQVVGTGEHAVDADGKQLPAGSIECIDMPAALGRADRLMGPEVFRRFTGSMSTESTPLYRRFRR